MSVVIDIAAAVAFLAGHGRGLDRRRLELVLGVGDPGAVLAALDGYRNGDGGYGWGLEPDLRSPESQPTSAMHAFEVLAEVAGLASTTSPRAVELCDWLDRHSLGDGGLPFTLPVTDPAACSPVWLGTDHTTSSLQMTAQVAANAHLLARHDPLVAGHPWLARATDWCFDAIAGLDAAPPAHELLFAVRFLDAVAEHETRGSELLDQLQRLLPAGGVVPVAGGAPNEALRPLDFAPRTDGPARRLFAAEVIADELARLAGRQQPDGGWTVDFEAASPAAALEWRGYATVGAVKVCRDGRGRADRRGRRS
jgi:hypothetical protein